MKEAPLHTVCAWCDRVRTPTGDWRPVEDHEMPGPSTTHGICPECLERATPRATMATTVAG